jgi:hypothetical protein
VIVAAGAIGFAIGVGGFVWLGLNGIVRTLNDLPVVAVAAGLSVVLALAALAIAALFAVPANAETAGRQWWRSTI